jgi:hypothetical protein
MHTCPLKRLPDAVISCSCSYLKAVACHTTLVFVDRALAVFLRVVALAEEHAFVTGGFFVFADAAGFGFAGGGRD